MGLEFILGGSGYGKSTMMYQEIVDRSLSESDKKFMILVPEQYTLQIQKKITAMHKRHGVINVDILSFQRLAERVFEELGRPDKTILGETGKVMFIRRILKDSAKELSVFGSNADKKGFAEEVKSMLSELIQYNISPEDMEEAAEDLLNKRPALSGKLKDLALIFRRFKDISGEEYITAEEVLVEFSKIMDGSRLIKESIFYLDEFTGFTPCQKNILEKLISLSPEVKVALTVDAREDPFNKPLEGELFGITKETVTELEKLCRNAGGSRESQKDIILERKQREESSREISFLESNIFRNESEVYDETPSDIKLVECRDLAEETDLIADTIDDLVKNKGYRYRDFGVIASDQEGYRRFFERSFRAYRIPFFMDDKRSIDGNPFVEYIRGLLNIKLENFSYDSIFSFLKTGFSGLDEKDTDLLDNFVLEKGIRGKNLWEKEWTEDQNREKEDSKAGNPERISVINDIRSRLMDLILPLEDTLFGPELKGRDRNLALKDFLEKTGSAERLLSLKDALYDKGEQTKAQEYEKIYDSVMEILDKYSEIMGEDVLSLKEYKSILEEGFANVRLGVVPSVLDETFVGDIRRTRLNDVKILFFAGLNDDLVPGQINTAGILNDADKRILTDKDMVLSPDKKKRAYDERFYIYTILSKPSDSLYLTFSRTGADNKPLRPSSLIGKIKKVFPLLEAQKCHIPRYDGRPLKGMAGTLSSESHLAMDDQLKQVISFLKEQKEEDEALKEGMDICLEGAFYENSHGELSPDAREYLFRNGDLYISVTALEKFCECKFRFFAEISLGLKERKEKTIRVADLGTLYHTALEMLALDMMAQDITWKDMSYEQLASRMDECITRAVEKTDPEYFSDSARSAELLNKIRRTAVNIAQVYKYQMDKGVFSMEEVEKRLVFSPADIEGGKRIYLRGTLDRLDTYRDDQNTYLKLIDYKSGGKKFDLNRVYQGRDLQLFLYMGEITRELRKKENGRNIIPAATIYLRVQDPFVKAFGEDTESILSERRKELRAKGIVNSDKNILKLLDKDTGPEYRSAILPFSMTKNDTVSHTAGTVAEDTDHFTAMEEHVRKKAYEMAEEIYAGAIDPAPVKDSTGTACRYCPYKRVCGFDPAVSGYGYRKLKNHTSKTIWEKVFEEEQEDA